MIIAVDFDGTIVEHDYPEIGAPVRGAVDVLKKLISRGHKIILYTMRSHNTLAAAVSYCEQNGVSLFGVNENPEQKSWTASPKVFANAYIDDAAIGCPLIFGQSRRPFVCWQSVERSLIERGFLKAEVNERR